MNLPKPKKYFTLPLVLVSFLLTNTTLAQTMPAPENISTTSIPVTTDEPIIQVGGSSTPNGTPQAIPRGRGNINSEQRAALTKVSQDRIINLAANISNRMDAAVARLSSISLRLEQRIIKMEESGTETSLAQEKLLIANELLATTKLKLVDIDTLVNEATLSTQPQTNWRTVRERYQEVSSLIRQAHLALSESIIALKNPTIKIQEIATSSAPATPVADELISN